MKIALKEKLVVLALALVTVSFIFAGVPIAASSPTTFTDTKGWLDPAWNYRDLTTMNNVGLVFSDNFNDGDDSGWTVFQGDWQVINGEYVYGTNRITDIDGVTVAGDVDWENYVFEARFKLIDGDPQIYFLFRFTDYVTYERYDGYSFQLLQNRWDLIKWVTTGEYPWLTYLATYPNPSPIISGEWYDVKVEVSGDSIKCYLNNELKLEANDATHPIGRIGFRADVCKVAFDDVKVSSGGLVGYWKFDEGSGITAYDNSGYGNHGAIYGATWTQGKINEALYFDGLNDGIEVPDSTSLHISNTITVAAWIKYEGGDETQTNAVATKRYRESGFSLRTEGGKAIFNVGSTYFDGVIGETALQSGGWYHLAGTYDGATQNIYVNGALDGTRSYPGQLSYNTASLLIGLYVSGETGAKYGYFKGIIDEVLIYNRALSSDEIAELAGLAGQSATSLSVYPSSFTIESGQTQTLTATLASDGSPLTGKAITWSATSGSISFSSGTTNSSGQVAVTYTAPTVNTSTSVTVTASFAGDNQYQSSAGTSSGTISFTPQIEAVVDIKPDTLQIGSMGRWVTCYIELPGENVDQIDISSIMLKGVVQVDPDAPTEVGDYDGDGASDLMVKFDRSSVENVVAQGLATLTVTGRVNGLPFTGSDTIDVIQTPSTSRPPGALVSVRRSHGAEPIVRYDIYSFTLDLSTEVSEEMVEVVVSSETWEGQTIVLNIDNNVLKFKDLDEIEVLFDNQDIEMADDYEDVLDPTNENVAEYVVIFGKEGIQLLVSIPHFSDHIITVEKAAAPSPTSEGVSTTVMLAVFGVALVAIISVAWVALRQARGEATSELIEHGLSGVSLQEADIFREIREQKEFTIPELIQKTSASMTVAWRTVQKLIEAGLVEPTGEVRQPEAGRGKPSTVYRYVGGR